MKKFIILPNMLRLQAIAVAGVAALAFSLPGQTWAAPSKETPLSSTVISGYVDTAAQYNTSTNPLPTKPGVAPAEAASGEHLIWENAKTDRPVFTVPEESLYDQNGFLHLGYNRRTDPTHAFNPITDQHFAFEPGDFWIDVKTGSEVDSIPRGCLYWVGGFLHSGYGGPADPNHAVNPITGRNFVRVPAPATIKLPTIRIGGHECCDDGCHEGHAIIGERHAISLLSPERFDLGVGYLHLRTADEDVKNLDGGQVTAFYRINRGLAVGGELNALTGSETVNKEDVTMNRFEYLFGPQVSWRPCREVKLYGQALFGGVHDSTDFMFSGNTFHASGDAFAMEFGGGIDFRVMRHLTIGPEINYDPTHFIPASPNGNHWQNNWSVGVDAKYRF